MTINLESMHKFLEVYNQMCRPLCQEMDMPQTAFDILMFFGNNPQYKTAADLVKIRGIKANLVSVHVERLVQEGYLKRNPVPGDRRKYELECTSKAEQIWERGREVQEEFFEKLFCGVTPEERQIYEKVIRQMENNLNKGQKRS